MFSHWSYVHEGSMLPPWLRDCSHKAWRGFVVPGRRTRVFFVLLASVVLAHAAPAGAALAVRTDPGDLPQLETKDPAGKLVKLPLEHTRVKAELTGDVARVEVRQTYGNPFDHPIEAIYVFPLPENSAVDGMKMIIGDRVIEAEIKSREQARKTYQEAKRQGHTAALLEQERPNVFTQSIANLEPKKKIEVVIRYLQDLTYDAGEYEFVFPMVVGPRFFPEGTRSEAEKINPPVLGKGTRSGHDISLELTATAGLPITTHEVPTHDVVETATFDGSLKLSLARHDSLPNRDFVLRYHVDGTRPQATLLTHKAGKGGFLSLIVQPPKLDIERLVGQREVIFVVDVSGSMSGVPLAMCQDAMRQALRQLRPVDTFNIITFAGATGKAFSQPLAANEANIRQGQDYVNKMMAGGGTYMLDAIQAALDPSAGDGRHRYVFFMTDGYVGNETQILAAAETMVKKLGRGGRRAKVFGFGVGSSVNRMLLDGLGRAGRGLTVYSTTREDPSIAVNKFFRSIDSALIEDVKIDWGSLAVEEVLPRTMPDLFASRPLVVHARYQRGGEATITVHGTHDGRVVELPVKVTLPEEQQGHAALATLWARAKIDGLERELWTGESAAAIDAITNLGVGFGIVTRFTSFVAVDRSRIVGTSDHAILQPVEVPEGVDPAMAGSRFAQVPSASPGGVGGLGLRGGAGYGRGVAAGTSDESLQGSIGRKAKLLPMIVPETATTAEPREKAKDERQEGASEDDKKDISGSLAESEVENVVRAHRAGLAQCAERAKGASGKLVLRWFVTATGTVIQLKPMSSTLTDTALEKCVLAEIKRWTFPAPSDGGTVRITYTFRF